MVFPVYADSDYKIFCWDVYPFVLMNDYQSTSLQAWIVSSKLQLRAPTRKTTASQCIRAHINRHKTENAPTPILNLNSPWCCFYPSSPDKLLKVLVNKRSLCSIFSPYFLMSEKSPGLLRVALQMP